MTRFLKVEGESVWINAAKVDGILVRPQLQAVGLQEVSELEERHESTGAFEVVVFFDNKLMPVRSFTRREEAEAFVEKMLSQLT